MKGYEGMTDSNHLFFWGGPAAQIDLFDPFCLCRAKMFMPSKKGMAIQKKRPHTETKTWLSLSDFVTHGDPDPGVSACFTERGSKNSQRLVEVVHTYFHQPQRTDLSPVEVQPLPSWGGLRSPAKLFDGMTTTIPHESHESQLSTMAHMGVSINGGTPKWVAYTGKSH